MPDPIISLIGPAKRTKLWLAYYEMLKSNEVPFELIFVGPEKPTFSLPENFKYVYSDVKPQQCLEAASRLVKGEYIMPTVDDIVYSEHALDKLYAAMLGAKSDLAIGSLIYKKHRDRERENRFIRDDQGSPLMPYLCGIYKKSVWRNLGGLDNRFVSSHGETDMTLRIIERGGFVIYADNVFLNEIVKKNSSLWQTYGRKFDHPLMMRLWTRGWGAKKWGIYRKFSKTRRDEVRSYKNEGILTASQGFIGTWPGK